MDRDTREQYEMQGAIQQNTADTQRSLYAPETYEKVQRTQAVLVEQTNPSKLVQDILLRLQGKSRDSHGRLVQVSKPKVNQAGISDIWFVLDSHINDNTRLSRLDSYEIGNIMDSLSSENFCINFSLSRDLVKTIALKWKVYGIANKADLDLINDSILLNIFLILKRAQGQNEKNWLGKISVENINTAPRLPQTKREGFFSKLRL